MLPTGGVLAQKLHLHLNDHMMVLLVFFISVTGPVFFTKLLLALSFRKYMRYPIKLILES
jgi:hypothetical protein